MLIEIEFVQEKRVQEKGNRDWLKYKSEQKRAESDGLLATDEDYAVMREKLRELFGDPTKKERRV